MNCPYCNAPMILFGDIYVCQSEPCNELELAQNAEDDGVERAAAAVEGVEAGHRREGREG